MTTATSNKKKKHSGAKVHKMAKDAENKVKGKRNLRGIITAVAAPVALLAIGYGLTRLDARMGGKVMGMLMHR